MYHDRDRNVGSVTARQAAMRNPTPQWLSAPLRALADLLAPRGCVACGEPVARAVLCDPCAVSLLDAPDPPPGVLVAHEHGGALARAVHRAKYDGDPTRAARLGDLLLPLAAELARPVRCVVPVPLHPRRLRERGYNQSMELARPVARALGCPLLADGLVRLRDTPTQTALARAGRAANVAGVFRAAAGRALAGGHVVIVDDVVTTGSTMGAAMAAARAAGAASVTGLALSRMPRRDG